jgi:type IV secretory pathway VirB4 component
MLDNIPCQIFLPNEKAHLQHDLYQGRFGLTDTQINTIKTMQRKREYYVVVPGASRKISAYFPKTIQPILDSKASVQELFDKHMATRLNDWRDNYYAEALRY